MFFRIPEIVACEGSIETREEGCRRMLSRLGKWRTTASTSLRKRLSIERGEVAGEEDVFHNVGTVLGAVADPEFAAVDAVVSREE